MVQSHLPLFQNLGNFVHLALPVSFGRLKAGGPFYLVSMPGEVKDPTRGKCVTCRFKIQKLYCPFKNI